AGDERVFTPARESLRKRLPWLGVNLATAFLAASVVGLFTGTIDALPILAVFMPIVAGMGGNAATQTLTVIVRGIALGELSWSNSRKALIKEATVGMGNGRQPGARTGPVRGDDYQHVRGGNRRHARPAGPSRRQYRPGAGLVRVHHHADGCCRLFLVSRPGLPLRRVPCACPLTVRLRAARFGEASPGRSASGPPASAVLSGRIAT